MRALLAALIVCLIAYPSFAAKQPKAVLIQKYLTRGDAPDIAKRPIPKDSADDCWTAAKAFTDKGLPEDLKGIAIAPFAGCVIQSTVEDGDSM